MKDIIFFGSVFGKNKQGYYGSTYGVEGVCPTLLTNSVTGNKLYILIERKDDKKHMLSNPK